MSFNELLLLVYIGAMMVVGFYLIYSVFSRKTISSRLLLLVFSFIAYMSLGTIIASYIIFWGGNLYFGVSVLLASAVAAGYPVKSRDLKVEWRKDIKYTTTLVLILILYELSMGYVYASVVLPHSGNPLLLAINNPDFSLMMLVDGAFFLAISEKKKDISEIALATFAFSMALMPNFFIQFSKTAILASVILSASIMAVNIVFLYVIQMRRKTSDMQILAIVLAASDFLMMLGLSSFSIKSDLYLISAAMIVSMISYFFLVTYRQERRQISHNYSYSFLLLLLINGAELAMSFGVTTLGMSASDAIFPKSSVGYSFVFSSLPAGMVHSIDFSNPLWWLFPFDPWKMGLMAYHMGLSVNLPFAYFWSSFMLLMTTTMSPFYAIMMGSEMSYLVFERYRKTGNRSVRNWALAIIAGIPVFVILIPFYTPYYIFGMSGMLFAIPLIALVVSLAAIIIASVLFGRKAQCNLVCMAAHMWTNVYYDQFRPKKNSSLWPYLRWVFFAFMVASFSLYALQQMGIMGPIKLGMVTINPLDFYGMFILNYIWWIFYFLTPVFGTYSCARHGWCGFGTLAGIFNKVFFRIKVRETDVCRTCKTRECESPCPTSIPLGTDFLNKGYSNRISCIGCGNCAEACPSKNLMMVDIRDYIKGKSLKSSPAKR